MPNLTGTSASDTIRPLTVSSGVDGGFPGADADSISGLGGNDTIDGGLGANTILGGDGNDIILASGGSESLDGGAGTDALLFINQTAAVVLDLGAGTATGASLGRDTVSGFESVTLSSFDDLGTGSGAAEFLNGFNGTDTVRGLDGNDTINGGKGSDSLDGGSGTDTADFGEYEGASTQGAVVNLTAATVTLGGTSYAAGTARDNYGGTDTLAGFENITGSPLDDVLFAGDGGASINAAAGSDLVTGGSGKDTLLGSAGDDTLLGLSGSDVLNGGEGNDSLDGGLGADFFRGSLGRDSIEGGDSFTRNTMDYRGAFGYPGGAVTVTFLDNASATVVKASNGATLAGGPDTLHAINVVLGSGFADSFDLHAVSTSAAEQSVLIRGGSGGDTITGNGSDRVAADYSDINDVTAPISVDLALGTASDGQGGTDSLVNIRAVVSSFKFNDTLSGSGFDDTFIVTGTGSKTIAGGGGNDTYRYQGTAAVFVDLRPEFGTPYAAHGGIKDDIASIERAYGGLGADTLKGSNAADTLAGDAGNDQMDGRAGVDMVDYGVFSSLAIAAGVTVDLATGAGTDPWGGTDTLANIEAATGTAFDDRLGGSGTNNLLIGAGGNDTIEAGGGGDTLQGGAGTDLLDGGAGFDVADFGMASAAATWTRDAAGGGWTVTSAEGTDRLQGIEALRFTDQTVTLGQPGPGNDLNGDGHSDILWRQADGTLVTWTMQGTTGTSLGISTVASAWSVVGRGNFDGDGKDDLLWRHADGTIAQWRMNGATYLGGGSFATVDAAWKTVGVGDLNGDGRADILWQHTDGTVSAWLMDGTASAGGGVIGNPGAGWTIVGLGDFNGDGRSDLIGRHEDGRVAVLLMDGTAVTASGVVAAPGASWAIAGAGDFDGDGKSDLLWRNAATGSVSVWIMDGLTPVSGAQVAEPGTGWNVANIGDYDADGRADILWRSTGGEVSIWMMNGTAVLSATGLGNPGTDWAVL